jgi:hypothetical protein
MAWKCIGRHQKFISNLLDPSGRRPGLAGGWLSGRWLTSAHPLSLMEGRWMQRGCPKAGQDKRDP